MEKIKNLDFMETMNLFETVCSAVQKRNVRFFVDTSENGIIIADRILKKIQVSKEKIVFFTTETTIEIYLEGEKIKTTFSADGMTLRISQKNIARLIQASEAEILLLAFLFRKME